MQEKEKYSLNHIITEYLKENAIEANEGNVKTLSRAFERLVKRLGSDKKVLMNERGQYEFDETEKPFIKVLLAKLYEDEGIIAEFTNERHRNKKFSVREIHNFIQSLLDGADEAGMSEEDLMNLAQFFIRIFLVSPLRSIEYCHTLIDLLALNLQDLTSDEQALYLRRVEHFLKKEFGLRIAESMLHINELGYLIEC